MVDGGGIWISPDIFEADLRPPDWPDDPDVRRAVDWILAFLEPDDWKRRRFAALQNFVDAASGEVPTSLGGKGRFFDERDLFAWYLFLAQAFLDHPVIYDYTFGSRVLPIMASIGRNVELLRGVRGIEARVRRMIGGEKGQPNACLFELLVAATYRRRGAEVSFVEEQPGIAKTHDLDVLLEGTLWAVECKRLEVGQYTEDERTRARQLWLPLAQGFQERNLDVYCNTRFLVELSTVPVEYLAGKVKQWLAGGMLRPVIWSDSVSIGEIRRLDLGPLKRVLKSDDVALNSSRLYELLTGAYKPNGKFISALHVQRADNPLYVSECLGGTVFDWESLSAESIDAKARDVLKRLSDANGQLPDARPSIIHVGFEAVDGLEVERARYDKIIRNIAKFDPGVKQLEYAYVTWFAPESPPNNSGAFDETSHWQAVRPRRPRPLDSGLMVLPPHLPSRDGAHWQPAAGG